MIIILSMEMDVTNFVRFSKDIIVILIILHLVILAYRFVLLLLRLRSPIFMLRDNLILINSKWRFI